MRDRQTESKKREKHTLTERQWHRERQAETSPVSNISEIRSL